LDNLFYALEKVDGTKEFANISNEIYKMEVTHFKSKSYNDKKDKIMQSSKEKIINIFNIESSI
jgi:hypothetical protein